jgi:hypothetical protein
MRYLRLFSYIYHLPPSLPRNQDSGQDAAPDVASVPVIPMYSIENVDHSDLFAYTSAKFISGLKGIAISPAPV